MTVLVDTSLWVDYFRSGKNQSRLEQLIDENLIVTNDLILAELTPFLKVRGGPQNSDSVVRWIATH